jgi:hypothetical protein
MCRNLEVENVSLSTYVIVQDLHEKLCYSPYLIVQCKL